MKRKYKPHEIQTGVPRYVSDERKAYLQEMKLKEAEKKLKELDEKIKDLEAKK